MDSVALWGTMFGRVTQGPNRWGRPVAQERDPPELKPKT